MKGTCLLNFEEIELHKITHFLTSILNAHLICTQLELCLKLQLL